MVAFKSLLASLLLLSSAIASPVRRTSDRKIVAPTLSSGLGSLLCDIPIISNLLCSNTGSSAPIARTLIGKATGAADIDGVTRYAVKYGSASRWGESSVMTTWEYPNGATNASVLPLMCPQPGVDDSQMSEDCLSMILYVPQSTSGAMPTFMWIHGGSYYVGSATDPGLDGSALAVATNSIVAVIQYRLGALGFMAPSGETNLAVKDVITALKFLQENVEAFGGNGEITIAGQSSGADMIRALLATPSASDLFDKAILQSDPMDYGFLLPSDQTTLLSFFMGNVSCSASDTTCLDALSLDDIITAGENLYDNAYTILADATQAEPIRPVRDGSLITNPMDLTQSFGTQSKPLLITNVLDEAGPSIYGSFTEQVPEDEFQPIVNATFGTPRTSVIVASPHYAAPYTTATNVSLVDARSQLNTLGTDYIWRCAAWSFAREWVGAGADAYVGLYVVGATYPGNEEVPFCTEAGSVCHQDDIEIVFGTVPSPTTAQAALTKEMQARYSSFMRTGNPNPSDSSYATWSAVSGTNVPALLLGGTGTASIGACQPTFWGVDPQYDYQVYSI